MNIKHRDLLTVTGDDVVGLIRDNKGVMSKIHLPKGTTLIVKDVEPYTGGLIVTFYNRPEIIDVKDGMRGLNHTSLIERVMRKILSLVQ